jgi:WD40 repeat protein
VRQSTPHRVIGRHDGGVIWIAFGEIDGAPVVVSGGYDDTIRRWDARTGEPIGKPLERPKRAGSQVAFGMIDGATVIVSGDGDGIIRRWDARTGKAVGAPLEGHDCEGRSVAFGMVDDMLIKVSGGSDGNIRRFDARTGEPIGEPLKGQRDPVNAIALGLIDGAPVIVSASGKESAFTHIGYISGGDDNSIRRWNARTGQPIGNPLQGHVRSVVAVGFGMMDGAPVIISGGEDNTIRLWDARLDNSMSEPFEETRVQSALSRLA